MEIVLIIDDLLPLQNLWKMKLLRHNVQVLSATSIEEAEAWFVAEKERIRVIFIDGCVPGNVLNTIPLVKKLRKDFRGPMIAISSDPAHQLDLIKAGCDDMLEKKIHLPETVLELLSKN